MRILWDLALEASDLLQRKMNSFSSELNRYPDGNAYELKEAISKKYNVDLKQITIGNGSNDLIEFVSRCFLGEGKKAIYFNMVLPFTHWL